MTIKKSPDFTADDKAWQYIRELEAKLKRKSDEFKAHKKTYFYKAFQAAEERIDELEQQAKESVGMEEELFHKSKRISVVESENAKLRRLINEDTWAGEFMKLEDELKAKDSHLKQAVKIISEYVSNYEKCEQNSYEAEWREKFCKVLKEIKNGN